MPQTDVITLIAEKIDASGLHRVREALETHGFRLSSLRRIHEDEFHRIEIVVENPKAISDPSLKAELLRLGQQTGVDIGIEPWNSYQTPKRILVMDIDSTLIQNEVINELALEHGALAQIAGITRDAMEGRIDFDESLRRRCRLLRGMPVDRLERVHARLKLTPGAQELVRGARALGFKIGLISGGFSYFADRLKNALGLDYAFSNHLEIKHGVLTGEITPPILDAAGKAETLAKIAALEGAGQQEIIAVGDGANDIPMLERAGLGIAFNAKPVVRPRAHLALHHPSLKSVLYLIAHTPDQLACARRAISTQTAT